MDFCVYGHPSVGDAPPGSHPPPSCETKVKMMWDDEYLYIGALLHGSLPVISSFTERNSPIFHRDSDFEVFIDADASCHAYKELGIKCCERRVEPDVDPAVCRRGRRVLRSHRYERRAKFYEVDAQRTATRVLSGKLNDPDSGPCSWSVEIALAHSDTTRQLAHAAAPVVGRRWRINFSRVEKGGEINWTWAPQVTWDHITWRYAGQVNMHLPDAWGYIGRHPPPVMFHRRRVDPQARRVQAGRRGGRTRTRGDSSRSSLECVLCPACISRRSYMLHSLV